LRELTQVGVILNMS